MEEKLQNQVKQGSDVVENLHCACTACQSWTAQHYCEDRVLLVVPAASIVVVVVLHDHVGLGVDAVDIQTSLHTTTFTIQPACYVSQGMNVT